MTLAQLKKTLQADTYTPKTEEELQIQAQNRYLAEYGEKKLAAQQANAAQTAALDRQADTMKAAYERQMAQSAQATRQNLSDTERAALSKGMQRSSYNAADLSRIRAAGEGSLNALRQGLLQEQSRLEAERARLAGQLADMLAQYDISFEADVQAYLDSLRDQEYERQTEAKQYADKIARALYEYELKAGKGVGAGSGTGSSSQKKNSSTAKNDSSTLTGLKNALTAGATAGSAAAAAAKTTGSTSLIARLASAIRTR